MVAVVIVAAPAPAVTAFASTFHIHNHRGVLFGRDGMGAFAAEAARIFVGKTVELNSILLRDIAILRDIF